MNGDAVPWSGTDRDLCGNVSSKVCPLNVENGTTYLIRFMHSSEVAACSFEGQGLHAGEVIVAPSRYGKDLARVLGTVRKRYQDSGKIIVAERIADDSDLAEYKKNLSFEANAVRTCRRRTESRRLKMKILSAHLLAEEHKLIIFFTADSRVDFRDLVRDLVADFHMRMDLRQIGVRDETRLLGGVGICGRVLCCHSFPDQMCTVSIRMAKEQSLSLGSAKLSGPCGRLMCCLSYEYNYYVSERGKFPKHGTRVAGPSTSYTVAEVNMISRTVMLIGREGSAVAVGLDKLRFDTESKSWYADFEQEPESE